MQLLVAPLSIRTLPSIDFCAFLIETGNVVPLFCTLLITHISSGGSRVVRYCVGLYCFSSQADLHSSTSRLYMSMASSISAYSHLMCVISSSVFSSSAGFSFCFNSCCCWVFSVSFFLCRKGFLNWLYGLS